MFVQYKGIIAIPVEAAIGLHYLNTTTVGGQVALDNRWYQISQNMCIFMLSVYSNFCKYLLIPKDTLKQEIFLFINLNAFSRLWTFSNKCVTANPINVVFLEERCCGAWIFMRSPAFLVHILWNSTNWGRYVWCSHTSGIQIRQLTPEQSCMHLSLLMLSITQLFMTITFFLFQLRRACYCDQRVICDKTYWTIVLRFSLQISKHVITPTCLLFYLCFAQSQAISEPIILRVLLRSVSHCKLIGWQVSTNSYYHWTTVCLMVAWQF